MNALIKSAIVAAAVLPFPAQAQDASFDIGLGASYAPTYPGADDHAAGPWLIWRRQSASNPQGFGIGPSFSTIGPRDASDSPTLAGTADIDRAFELGGKVSYGIGPVTAYGALRKGFGGHEGVVGEIGATYRTDVNDRLTLWSGLELGYGNDDYMQTYFGTAAGYTPSGGLATASARVEARYSLTDSMALMGQIEYSRLLGDAADSPLVEDKAQPRIRLGITRSFSFGF